jgi:nicotinamide-nucleotide adenylyltransferase
MFRREEWEGTEVRGRMRNDGDWESLVPAAVAEVVHESDGVSRIQQVSDTDSNGRAEG